MWPAGGPSSHVLNIFVAFYDYPKLPLANLSSSTNILQPMDSTRTSCGASLSSMQNKVKLICFAEHGNGASWDPANFLECKKKLTLLPEPEHPLLLLLAMCAKTIIWKKKFKQAKWRWCNMSTLSCDLTHLTWIQMQNQWGLTFFQSSMHTIHVKSAKIKHFHESSLSPDSSSHLWFVLYMANHIPLKIMHRI